MPTKSKPSADKKPKPVPREKAAKPKPIKAPKPVKSVPRERGRIKKTAVAVPVLDQPPAPVLDQPPAQVLDQPRPSIDIMDLPPERFKIKQASGAQKMRQYGKRGILLSVTQEQYDLFHAAAKRDFRKLTPWIIYVATIAANRT